MWQHITPGPLIQLPHLQLHVATQVAAAGQHARRVLLARSLYQWQQYVQHRKQRSAQDCVAAEHHSRALLARALVAFKQCVRAAAQKRRHMFAAALHRRSWLIRRGFRAWR